MTDKELIDIARCGETTVVQFKQMFPGQKEIAKELGISRSYVSRIEKRALTKILREFIKNKKQ